MGQNNGRSIGRITIANLRRGFRGRLTFTIVKKSISSKKPRSRRKENLRLKESIDSRD